MCCYALQTVLNCLHINFSKLKTKNLEKMSAVYHEMFRFCEFTKIGKSNISFNLQLIRVNPSRSSFKWKYWNYNITPLIAPPNLGLKPFFNCHLNFYVVYALGVSPSFISRYCEDYRFWSIWGRVPLRTLHLKFQKARTKIEVVLSLPCWLSQFSLLKF